MNRTVPFELIPAFSETAAAVHALPLPASGLGLGFAPGIAGDTRACLPQAWVALTGLASPGSVPGAVHGGSPAVAGVAAPVG